MTKQTNGWNKVKTACFHIIMVSVLSYLLWKLLLFWPPLPHWLPAKMKMWWKWILSRQTCFLFDLVVFKKGFEAADLFLIQPCSLQGSPSFSRSSPQDSPEKATSHTKLVLRRLQQKFHGRLEWKEWRISGKRDCSCSAFKLSKL